MKDKPDVQSFLAGADEPASAKGQKTVTYSEPHPRVQKIFRLRWDLSISLKDRAALESAQQDRKVTETEIVERALNTYLDR